MSLPRALVFSDAQSLQFQVRIHLAATAEPVLNLRWVMAFSVPSGARPGLRHSALQRRER